MSYFTIKKYPFLKIRAIVCLKFSGLVISLLSSKDLHISHETESIKLRVLPHDTHLVPQLLKFCCRYPVFDKTKIFGKPSNQK